MKEISSGWSRTNGAGGAGGSGGSGGAFGSWGFRDVMKFGTLLNWILECVGNQSSLRPADLLIEWVNSNQLSQIIPVR